MVEFSDFDDFFSVYPTLHTPCGDIWSDFIVFIDDDTKGDLIESKR